MHQQGTSTTNIKALHYRNVTVNSLRIVNKRGLKHFCTSITFHTQKLQPSFTYLSASIQLGAQQPLHSYGNNEALLTELNANIIMQASLQ